MSMLSTNILKKINLEKDNFFIINIPFNLLKRYITRTKPKINNNIDTFTIYLDNIKSEIINCKIGTIINLILNKNDLYLMHSQLFFDECIFDEDLFLSNKNNDIFIILKETGTYYFSSKNCNNKIIIIVK
jgi:hypothetical protein